MQLPEQMHVIHLANHSPTDFPLFSAYDGFMVIRRSVYLGIRHGSLQEYEKRTTQRDLTDHWLVLSHFGESLCSEYRTFGNELIVT